MEPGLRLRPHPDRSHPKGGEGNKDNPVQTARHRERWEGDKLAAKASQRAIMLPPM